LLSTELRIFAISEKEGLVEGLYHPSLPIAGIQWHPERKSPDKELNEHLIRSFMERKMLWRRLSN